jgi:hypothetical protein
LLAAADYVLLSTMWFLTIRAIPKPDSQLAPEKVVAYVSCWVNFQLQDGAELLARHYIDQAGWLPEEVEDAVWVVDDDYADDKKNALYYSEAETDGAALVFHETRGAGQGAPNPAAAASKK